MSRWIDRNEYEERMYQTTPLAIAEGFLKETGGDLSKALERFVWAVPLDNVKGMLMNALFDKGFTEWGNIEPLVLSGFPEIGAPVPEDDPSFNIAKLLERNITELGIDLVKARWVAEALVLHFRSFDSKQTETSR